MSKRVKTISAAPADDFVPDALAIRTCNKDGTSYGNFAWPLTVGAVAEAPDWDPRAECGNGLHGLLDGIGDWGLTSRDDALWQVVGVMRSECVNIDDGKVKFPRCRVEYVGGFAEAMSLIQSATVTKILEMASGNTATGYRGHAAATGDSGHAAATGDWGHAAATGYWGHAAVSGQNAVAASLGWNGSALAEAGGAIMLAHFNDDGELLHVFASKVGENGIEAGKTYRLNASGRPDEEA